MSAALRSPEIDIRSLDFGERRGFGRISIAEFTNCGYAAKRAGILLWGLADMGKSCLTCAFAKDACR